MGVYLSSPITEKFSDDGKGRNFTYGASSMQGWRLTQEDAHNCLADFDTDSKTTMLAVYDGHGGSEVAEYTALHLPDYIKGLQSYKEGKLGEALQEAFLGFDATIVTDEVVKELKTLVNLDKEEEAHDENEAEMLRADANIPIEELMAKYQKQGSPQLLVATKKQRIIDSPCIRSKKLGLDNMEDGDAGGLEDDVSSSSSISKITNGHADNENNLNTEKEFKDKHSAADSTLSERTDSKSLETDEEDKCSDSGSIEQSAKDSNSNASTAKTLETAAAGSSSTSSSSSSSSSSSKTESDGAHPSSSSSDHSISDKLGSPSSWEPQPGGSGCSPSKKKVNMDDEDETEARDEDEDEEDDVAEGMLDDDEESVLDESDEEYEGCDSSDDNILEEEEDLEEDEEEGDDYDHQNLMKDSEEPGMDSGCTAVVALLREKQLVVANAGDSRCVLCSNGTAVDLSIDHKPEDDTEKSRIEAAGGKVTGDGRVNGGLNLSRAIGDHSYKQNADLPPEEQMITALPDIQRRTITDDDEFLVLACDGIWNFMSSQEVVDFISEQFKDPVKRAKLSLICEELFDYCLAPNTMGDGTGCDNMTCLIMDLKSCSSGCKKRTSADAADSPELKKNNGTDATNTDAIPATTTTTFGTGAKDGDATIEQSVKRPKLADSSV